MTLTDPMIGRLVDGRYEVTSRIARGGMATVYLALDRRLDRQVALKIMHPHLAEGQDVVARFRREARAAARLAHPGVVGVYDQGSEGDTSYLTMEYVDGTNLRKVLSARGALPLGEVIDITESVLDALAAAHRAGLVHRDVKPENVLVASDGRVKVADFGLARAVTEATAATTGTLLGTVAYLSPEIVTSGVADARADVYAVGVLFYEMLTGHQPFQGETPIQVAYKHVHEDLPDASDDIAWLPIEVDELIAAFTARDPEERPADAGAALDMLRRIRHEFDDHVLAMRAAVRPDELDGVIDDVDRASADEGRTRSVRVSNHSGTISLPIGAISTERSEAAPPRPHRRRRRVLAVLAVLLLALTLGGGASWYFLLGPGAYIQAPDVVGQSETRAYAALEAEGLHPDGTSDYHDTVPAGDVISTDPGPGERVPRDGDVAVLVSRGILMLTVPSVVTLSEEDAVTVLTETGFTVAPDIDRPYAQDVEEGIAIATTPAAEAVVAHNTPLTLSVSAGRQPIEVPNVVGADQDTAISNLTGAGAEPQLGPAAYSDTVPEGDVISQTVKGPALRGDLVQIVVSLGPQLFPVPDVIGMQYDKAEALLVAAGFEVNRENVIGGIFGTVRLQSVDAGATKPRGTVITLTVV